MHSRLRLYLVRHHWDSWQFKLYLWILRRLGKRLGCGCKGVCNGHKGYIEAPVRWITTKKDQ